MHSQSAAIDQPAMTILRPRRKKRGPNIAYSSLYFLHIYYIILQPMEHTPSNEHHLAVEKDRKSKLGERSYDRFHGSEEKLLPAQEEIEAYIDSWDFQHKATIDTLHDEFNHEPLPDNLAAYVIIPVAVGQEIETLQKTLEQYARQDAGPSTWSLLLFLNHTETPETFGTYDEKVRQTHVIIEAFKRENPHLSVRVANKTYYNEPPPIGEIRADAWDCALYDVHVNDKIHDNLIGISHDADASAISPNYISQMQKAAVEHSLIDMFTCQLSWQKLGDLYSDANKVLHYWEYLTDVNRHTNGQFGAWDPNTAIRFGSYAAINGFNRNRALAEMLDIRDRLSIARRLPHKTTDHIHFIEDIWLETNSRRLYRAIDRGYSPDYAWSKNLPFLTGEDPARLFNAEAVASRPINRGELWLLLATMDHYNLWKIPDRKRYARIGREVLMLPQV